ncbi:5 nucleotid domain containing protein [Trichuris trichiura]|uniref:5 nucleotid domain containing protein n=1 Tax=Trichuris trichiura TaxID=36087 RepID=A0A077Z560_TRITR|nr:5 nucleotid domain containing protein [Trichuris trichiura]
MKFGFGSRFRRVFKGYYDQLRCLAQFDAHANGDNRNSVSGLWDLYRFMKTTVDQRLLQSPVNPTSVFANNELDLSEIDVYGFDYDYTLAIYRKSLNRLIYLLALNRLVSNYKYPEELKSVDYDPEFAVRGLHYDVSEGILFKLDAFNRIQKGTAYRGKRKLSDEEVSSIYGGLTVPKAFLFPDTSGYERTKQLHDLFSLPEVGLLANVIDYFEDNGVAYDSASLFHDVQHATRLVHLSGDMYRAVMENTAGYIKRSNGLRQFFERLVANGKLVFLISNSPFFFMHVFQTRFLQSSQNGAISEMLACATYSETTGDPAFITKFRLYQPTTNVLSWEKVTQITHHSVYSGGNLGDFLELTDIKKKGILYFGDHVYSDLAEPTARVGWRAGAIVPELTKEIRLQNSDFFRRRLAWLSALTSLVERFEQDISCDADSRMVLAKWNQEREQLREELKMVFNPRFGSLFRTYHSPSYFSIRLMRLADVYTSSVANLFNYGIGQKFYARRWLLPHESDLLYPNLYV